MKKKTPTRRPWTREKRPICTRVSHGVYAELERRSLEAGVSVNQVVVQVLSQALSAPQTAEGNGN